MGIPLAGPGRRRTLGLGAAVLLASPLLIVAGAAPASAASSNKTETVVVKFQAGSGTQHAASVIYQAGVDRATAERSSRYVMQVPASSAPQVLRQLQSSAGVQYAEVAQAVHAASTNDPCNSSPGCPASVEGGGAGVWTEDYLNTIGAPQAWNYSTGAGVRVAVLDSGVDATNPDLNDGRVVGQTNVCAADDPQCATNSDQLGHGTHVSGILAAHTNNGFGVASLGQNVQLDEYKVLDSSGGGNSGDVATAIYDAVAAGDRVINMSLANYSCQANPTDCGPDPDEEAAVEYAIQHNVVVVAAAGNDGTNGAAYPASYPGVLAVAATDNNGAVESFSQYGQAANIAAPGYQIVSTWPTYAVTDPNTGQPSTCLSLCVESGTSMATPQVAAAAALLISYSNAHGLNLSGPQVTTLLESSARPTSGGNAINGGLLNVPAALAAAANPPHSYNGYELAGSDGSVYSFGSLGDFGDVGSTPLTRPVVGDAEMPDGRGYWLVASDGGIFTFGNAGFYGSTGAMHLNKPIVGMAATSDGRGYWLVASDGGIFTFGDAGFYGSTGGMHLNKPIVGMAATSDGRGYWLVASDGGIFTFGDGGYYGSTGNIRLAQPIIGMATAPYGQGYWLVASDGGVFTFGTARFYGSTGGTAIPGPVVGVAS